MRIASVTSHGSDPMNPAAVTGGRHLAPAVPGFSTQMRTGPPARYANPEGEAWQ